MELHSRVCDLLLIRPGPGFSLLIVIRSKAVETNSNIQGEPVDVPRIVYGCPLVRHFVFERKGRVVRFDFGRCSEASTPERLDTVFGRKKRVGRAFVKISIADADVVVSSLRSGSVHSEDAG